MRGARPKYTIIGNPAEKTRQKRAILNLGQFIAHFAYPRAPTFQPSFLFVQAIPTKNSANLKLHYPKFSIAWTNGSNKRALRYISNVARETRTETKKWKGRTELSNKLKNQGGC